MDPLSPTTIELFKNNKLSGHFNYVRPGEVVPHFFSRGSYFLFRDEENRTLQATANSCLHRGFKLISERRKMNPGQSVGCKFHNWQYEKAGQLLSTPGFDREMTGCLKSIPLVDVGGGLFFESETIRSLSAINILFDSPGVKDLWIESYQFDQENVTFYHCNWKVFMEIYLDAYHHKHAHPTGLGMFITDEVEWYVSDEIVVNIVGIAPPGTPIKSLGWSKFAEEVQKLNWTEKWGAIFCTIFPGLMIEFFPHTMVISQLVPVSDKMTANYIQIYYDEEVRDNYDFQNAFSEAYSETSAEDSILQEMLEDGRGSKWYDVTTLPIHGTLELGIPCFYRWLERNAK